MNQTKMQVELKDITIGNFKYNAKAVLDDAQAEAVMRQGVLRLLQGKPSGDWEKGILKRMFPDAKKRDEIKVKDAETGEERSFRRTDIPFSTEDAEALKNAYSSVEFTIGENEKGEAIKSALVLEVTDVEEYTGGGSAVPKFAREKDFVKGYLAANGGKLKDGSARTAETFAANRGIAAPTEPWEEDSEFLASVKAWYVENILGKAASKD